MKKSMQKGFTLIELMIVVAIIAILAAIAIPAYQNYMAKSQATAALADITGAKVGIEEALNRGVAPSLDPEVDPDDGEFIGVKNSTARCNIALAGFSATTAEGSITCTIKDSNPKVNTSDVILSRDENGGWTCTTDISEAKFYPAGCSST